MKKTAFKLLLLAVISGLACNLIGCAALKRKFTRKGKPKSEEAFFTKVKRYDVKPNPDLYEKHYIFWVNWHKKLIAELGESHKSDVRSIQEMINNLNDMAAILVDEKAGDLKLHIAELKKAQTIIEERNLTRLNETRIRRIVEREYRSIRRNFAPRKITGCIKEDWG